VQNAEGASVSVPALIRLARGILEVEFWGGTSPPDGAPRVVEESANGVVSRISFLADTDGTVTVEIVKGTRTPSDVDGQAGNLQIPEVGGEPIVASVDVFPWRKIQVK
jgi:hypothetical protein